MSPTRAVLVVLALLLVAGCGGASRSDGATRERRTQREVTARLRPLIEETARAIVPSAQLVTGDFGGPIVVPCQDEGPVRTVRVSETYVIANTARGSATSYVAPARAHLVARGFRLSYADRYGVAGRRDGYVVAIASSPSGRPSVTGQTPCVPPTDPRHPVGL